MHNQNALSEILFQRKRARSLFTIHSKVWNASITSLQKTFIQPFIWYQFVELLRATWLPPKLLLIKAYCFVIDRQIATLLCHMQHMTVNELFQHKPKIANNRETDESSWIALKSNNALGSLNIKSSALFAEKCC